MNEFVKFLWQYNHHAKQDTKYFHHLRIFVCILQPIPILQEAITFWPLWFSKMFITSGISWYKYNTSCLSFLCCPVRGDIYLTLSEIDNIIRIVLQSELFYTPAANRRFTGSPSLPVFGIARHFNFSCSKENETSLSHGCFNFHFTD